MQIILVLALGIWHVLNFWWVYKAPVSYRRIRLPLAALKYSSKPKAMAQFIFCWVFVLPG